MSVLLIAHGSPDPRHSAAIESFAEQVQAASGIPTTVGYLDHNAPRVDDALATQTGIQPHQDSVLAVGLFLSTGYHVRVDVPKVLATAGPAVTDCGPLGLGDWLLPASGPSSCRNRRPQVRTARRRLGGCRVVNSRSPRRSHRPRRSVAESATRHRSERHSPLDPGRPSTRHWPC